MADKTTLGLYVTEKTQDGYYHVQATVVTIDEAGKIRNVGDDLIKGLYLDNFEIYSQGDNDKREKLYAWEIQYKPYAVRGAEAAQMAKTFKVVEARLHKLYESRGSCATFGQYVGRVAEAIGATAIVEQRGKGRGFSYEDNQHRVMGLGDGCNAVDYMVARWREALTTQAAAR